jgi:CRP/FNR family cyclic AMP-dependent transcriptional regulator
VNIFNEREQLLVSLSPPENFGEVALLDKKGRTAKATCVDDCQMLMIPRDDFQEILDDYPALYKNIVYILASWLRKDKTNKKELD